MNPLASARLSLIVGLLVLALKWVAYILTGSIALYSDALESIVNIAAAFAAFIALWIAQQPIDQNHPFGHTKAEYFSAGFEAMLIVIAAITIIYEASQRLWVLVYASGGGTSVNLEGLKWGLIISLLASMINGALASYLLHVAKKTRSPAIKADGLHLLSDVITSAGVLLGVGIAWMTGWWVLDPLLALIVALNILWIGAKLFRESIGGLMDEGMNQSELVPVQEVIAHHLQGALQVHSLKTRRAGAVSFVEFHLVVPENMTVKDAHDICNCLEDALQEILKEVHVNIHVEPDSEVEQHGFIVFSESKEQQSRRE
ncbi:MAG: cation-efflux pump [Beggiatoa sp. IS2]|nr:MAG: cation-efflux pump [Beggiatoa sp. IS2]